MHNPIDILLVEDEFLNRLYTKNTLRENGYSSLHEAADFSEAQNFLRKESVDLCILDINLGKEGQSGIELGKWIKEEVNVPIIYLTAYGTRAMFNKTKANEPSAFLVKPFTEIELVAAIELAVQKFQGALQEEHLIVKDKGVYTKIPTGELMYFESQGNYLKVATKSAEYSIRSTIKEMLESLNSRHFAQCHRGFVVNVRMLTGITSEYALFDGGRVPISKTFKPHLEKQYMNS